MWPPRRLGVAPDAVRLDPDRERRPVGLPSHRCREALVGEQRRVDPAGQGAQVIQGLAQCVTEPGQYLNNLAMVCRGVLQQSQPNHERDELLLGAVMKVAARSAAVRCPGP